MVVEWLKVWVPKELQAHYLEADRRIWTPFLSAHPGFISKQAWLEEGDPEAIILVIHWASRTQWEAVPGELLQAIEARFSQTLGQSFPLLESKSFEVWG